MITIDEVFRAAVRDAIRDVIHQELTPVIEALSKPPPPPPPPSTDDRRLLSPHEAAEIANVHEETVRSWVRSKRLKRYSAGRRMRVDRAEFERFLAAGHGGKEAVDIRVRARDILKSV